MHPFVRFLVLMATLAVIGLIALKPAYHAFRAWRLERNLADARKAVEEVRMDEARDLSLTVLRSGDPRIEAYRILEKSTASLRDPRHGDIARALMTHPESSDEDRLNGFRGVAPEAPLGVLGQTWASLPAKFQRDPRFASVFADRLIADGRINEAAMVLLSLPQNARNVAVDQRLVRILIRSGKQNGNDEAQRLIASKMSANDPDISGWLDLLEEIPVASLRMDLLAPVRKVLQAPESGEPARRALMLARLEYVVNNSGREALINDAIGRWKDQAPESLARFLCDLGQYRRLLDILPAERVNEHPELLPKLLEAMEKSGAWDQVVSFLDAHGRMMPKFEELAWRAVAAQKTGDSATQAQQWSAAMGEAKSSPISTAFLTLYRLARDAGMQNESEQALVGAIHLGRGPLPLYADLKPLLNSLARQGRENTLLEICAIYIAFEPGNPVLLTQYAYLACLNNVVDPKMILKAMEALAKGYPKELPIQMVLATAYLCDGQSAKAAEILDHLQLDPARLSPANRAALLTTQVLNRRVAKDDPRVTDFPWISLQPSERRKFSELIRTAKP